MLCAIFTIANGTHRRFVYSRMAALCTGEDFTAVVVAAQICVPASWHSSELKEWTQALQVHLHATRCDSRPHPPGILWVADTARVYCDGAPCYTVDTTCPNAWTTTMYWTTLARNIWDSDAAFLHTCDWTFL
jgi:hypothetical protein